MTALLKSHVESANSADCPFPLNNLPYGVFAPKSEGSTAGFRCGVAIGEYVLDLRAVEQAGLLPTQDSFTNAAFNSFMAQGPKIWAAVRERLTDLLSIKEQPEPALLAALHPLKDVQMQMPFEVTEFTDFYAGRHHAENVGTMFRGKDNALPPNWLHIPIGYNGRASTVVVSGTDITRPSGQLKAPQDENPTFGPSERLDIELEMGAVVGTPSRMGEPVSVAKADEMIFGYVLLNDWSARDIQAWEYQPLGPFQAKAFATSISPWIVTRAALEPFRTPTPEREKVLLPYLKEPGPMAYDIDLEVAIRGPDCADETLISRTNYREMYYSAAQQLAHHASSGCAMRTGDLLGSGTISGPTRESCGSLLEITWGGRDPFTLEDGSERRFLEDGDTITLRGHAQGDGYRIGFGACSGTIKPATPRHS